MAPQALALAPKSETQALDPATVANVLLSGDLAALNDQQRMAYCTKVCEALGLNPLTQPFAFLRLNNKLVMYAKKDATEQLRKLHGVSITSVTSQRVEDVFVVTASASDRTGRTDASTGAVALGSLKGEALANALMKAETKAKRRVTLSICGLGMLDELEAEPLAEPVPLVIEAPKADRPALPAGCFYILNVTPKQFGGDIAVVDANGTEETYPVPDRQCVALAEQIAQEGVPVTLERVKGARDGKVKVKAIHRYQPPTEAPSEPVAIDASEIPF
jgi:hypothetical protein